MEKDLFSIKEAAQMAQMTKETLRHYDRIGLVCPTFKNEQTKYRYYTKADIVRLNTVYALQQMDLSLEEIKEALSYNDLEKIILFLNKAEQKAEKKIHSLQYALKKIKLAKDDYEKKRTVPQQSGDFFILELEERTILLSDTLSEPSLDNLWDYLRHFKNLVPPHLKDSFIFMDSAGIYTENNCSRLFAICESYQPVKGLKTLPKGRYLCADVSDEEKEKVLADLLLTAEKMVGKMPPFIVEIIVVSGILQWRYQIQIPLPNDQK